MKMRHNGGMQPNRLSWILLVLVGLCILVAAGVLVLWPGREGVGKPYVSENVVVTAPLPGEKVSHAISVRGEARGSWFFEANLPLEVRDPSGRIVGRGHAMTAEEWMTTEFVSFEGKIIVGDYSGPATLVVKKDNPSGLPENDAEIAFDIEIE